MSDEQMPKRGREKGGGRERKGGGEGEKKGGGRKRGGGRKINISYLKQHVTEVQLVACE